MEHARPPSELNMDGGPVSRADAWKRWRQQFMLFMKASGVNSESPGVQASLLVNLIGPEGFDIYQTFTFDEETDRDDVEVTLKKFDNYFGTKENVTLLRYKFFTRNQEDGETMQQYVTALRLLSRNCGFVTLQEDLIKDRIVCGVRSATIRDRLLRCDNLDLDKAIKICQAEEISQESGRELIGRSVSGSASVSAGPVHVDAVERRWHRGGAGGARGGRRGAPPPTPMRGPRPPPARAPSCCAYCGSWNCVAGQCPAMNVTCFVCGKRGHFARVCKSSSVNNREKVKKIYEIGRDDDDESESDECESFYVMVVSEQNNNADEWYETLSRGNFSEKFKLDTGADINVLSYKKFSLLGLNDDVIKHSNIRLESYGGDVIPIKGVCVLQWSHKDVLFDLKFAIADIRCQSVLGRKSCEELGLVKRIQSVNLSNYEELFTGLGCLPGKYHIVVDKSVQPVICASRKIPLGIRDRLAEELKKMEDLGVIRKVSRPTQWVHPLVLAAKKNNGIRVCLDPRELNRAVQRAHFQLPTVTELAARLHGATHFSVLDANSGFWNIQLDEESADLCTFATPFGRYQFLRLPFGINCASEVFHAKMRQLLEDLDGTDSFIDDIIVWGRTKQEHDSRLKALLDRAKEINIKFNKEKCKLGVHEVVYLGHVFDKKGMRPDSNKIKAITMMPEPSDRKSLERFLGAVNYLSKFIPNYSEHALPLTHLLRKENGWRWEQSERAAFEKLKKCVCSAPVLALYDVARPVLLSVDASRDALGAVLMQDGRVVEYASRTLTDTQRRYAQVEKELLAIVFACERFHQYIFGKEKITVESDHKPLESIFKKPLMSVPARLQRMMLRIQGYDLIVSYKPGKYMYLADTLSRAPLPDLYSERMSDSVLYQVQMIVNNLPMSYNKLTLIKRETKRDTDFAKLLEYIKTEWPPHKHDVLESLRIYWSIKELLFTVDDVIFKDDLVVIPPNLRKQMLDIVHEGHQGIDRCKRRARQVLYWPNMSRDIEQYVRRCAVCQECSNAPPKEPMIPIKIPSLPWKKIGSDLFEYQRKYFLLIVDYYSNYVEVAELNNITSSSIIRSMKEIFSRHGIPEIVISDNGRQYSSREFKSFASEWGFEHVTSSPNYPQANGKSERAVQTIKALLRKSMRSNTDFQLALLNYRNTPRDHLSSPAQLLMGRRLRCKLPVNPQLLKPEPIDPAEYLVMLEKQQYSKNCYDKTCKPLPQLKMGDNVVCIEGKKRTRATVIDRADTPRSYIVQNNKGVRYRRNRRHLVKCETELKHEIDDDDLDKECDEDVEHQGEEICSGTDDRGGIFIEPETVTDVPISPPRPLTRSRAKRFNVNID